MLPDTRSGDPCLFVGRVVHRRTTPVRHAFRYRLALLCFDVDDTSRLSALAPWLGMETRAPVSWWRRDHIGGTVPLGAAVRDLVEERTGRRPQGAVRLLTSPRVLGYGFNPISLYFCDHPRGGLEAIVAEVTSTPWGERHCYVLPVPEHDRAVGMHRFVTPKRLHVSPFLGMRQDYRWRIASHGDRLSVAISATAEGARPFAAALSLVRRPLRRTSFARFLVQPPLGAAGTMAAIHFEALRLWWKGAPIHEHPHRGGNLCPATEDHDDRKLVA